MDYDDADHVTTLTDARGNVTTLDYYDNELLWKTTVTDRGHARVTTLRVRRRQPALEDDRSTQRRRDAPLLARRAAQVGPVGRGPRDELRLRHRRPARDARRAERQRRRRDRLRLDVDLRLRRRRQPHERGAPRRRQARTFYDALNRPYQWDDALNNTTSVSTTRTATSPAARTHWQTRSYTYDKLDRPMTESDERSKTTTTPTSRPASCRA